MPAGNGYLVGAGIGAWRRHRRKHRHVATGRSAVARQEEEAIESLLHGHGGLLTCCVAAMAERLTPYCEWAGEACRDRPRAVAEQRKKTTGTHMRRDASGSG